MKKKKRSDRTEKVHEDKGKKMKVIEMKKDAVKKE